MASRMTNQKLKTEYDHLLGGYLRTVALCSAARLGIFNVLDGNPRTVEKTAGLLDIDLRATEILMHALCALRLLRKEGDLFTLTDLSETFLSASSPSYAGNKTMLIGYMHERSLSLPAVMKTGRPQMAPPAATPALENRLRVTMTAMAEMGAESAKAVACAVDLSTVTTMLDLGGGTATYTLAMLEAKNSIQAVIFDRPSVLEFTREVLAARNLRQSVSLREGDFVRDDIGSGYDLILLSNVVHEYSPDENAALIRKASRALNSGGQLIVSDLVLDPGKTSPESAALFALEMLINTPGGCTFTEEEILCWMQGAGLSDFRSLRTPAGTGVVMGKRLH
jgi:SAM-dependent methyltransferase